MTDLELDYIKLLVENATLRKRIENTMELRPIDTAPKKTPILAYCKGGIPEFSICLIDSDGFMWAKFEAVLERYNDGLPTHWLPLPEIEANSVPR